MKMTEKRARHIEKDILTNPRRYKRFLYNKVFVYLIAVLLQISLFILILMKFYVKVGQIVLLTTKIFAVLFVLRIINRDTKPSGKLNWVIVILLFPLFGIPVYILFGEGKPTRKMKDKIKTAKKENEQIVRSFLPVPDKQIEGRAKEICNYIDDYAGYPAYTDGNVKYYSSGESLFEAMIKAIENAKESILIEYFIISGGTMWERFRNAIVKKANEGVQVRLIYDDWGCIISLPYSFGQYMEYLSKNIRCLSFNPIVPVFALRMNNRDHRKYIVVDGKEAFTGGINISDEYINAKQRFGHWKDGGVSVSGIAASSFTLMFFNVWNAFHKQKENVVDFFCDEVKQYSINQSNTPSLPPINESSRKLVIQPYDDCPLDGESIGETVYLDIINRAKKYVYITTPYLILDDFIRTALSNAAKRGVDVRIITPGIPDKKMVFRLTRANYDILLKSSVKIYEYTPGFIHSKNMVTDDNAAVVGTINLDYRSLYIQFENAVYFTEKSTVMDVKKDCEATFAISHLITEDDIKKSITGKLVDSILRVFETLV